MWTNGADGPRRGMLRPVWPTASGPCGRITRASVSQEGALAVSSYQAQMLAGEAANSALRGNRHMMDLIA